MSTLSLGSPKAEAITAEWRERITQAKEARKKFEPTWMMNLAFASGRQWLKWNIDARRLEADPELTGKDLYTTDFITEYRMTALGEMTSGDDRPQLLLVQNEEWSQQYQGQANRAMQYAWEHEWRADHALMEARRLAIDCSTAAIRCRFDPNEGPMRMADVPFQGSAPILDGEKARAYVAEEQAAGRTADLRSIREGRTRWEPLSSFNLLVPPGIPDEADFPWEIIVRPVPLEEVKATYGSVANDLSEDGNIGSLFGFEEGSFGFDANREQSEKVRGHVWLYTCYQRPNPQHPKGRVCVLAGNDQRLLHVREELPCVGPDGVYRSGVAYFHWWRVSGRFWSRSLVEALKDPQRLLNRRKTQNSEIIDRGMPMLLVQEGALKQTPRGLPMEKVEVRPDRPLPTITQGVGPGQWMFQEMEWLRNDLDHASGIKRVTLGENPAYVTTYSQLALLNENDQGKREPIYLDHQRAVRYLAECGLHYIRTYWGKEKQIMLASESEERVEAEMFNATNLPPFFILRFADGQAKPRSQAAMLKMIEDIAQYAAKSGQPLPVTWYAASLNAGEPAELPDQPANEHVTKASLENHAIVMGAPLDVAYYDPIEVHVPIHRSAQIQAELAGDMQLWQRFEDHILRHQAVTAQATQALAEIEPTQLPLPGEEPMGAQGGGAPSPAPAGGAVAAAAGGAI